jgi:low affinity Fe/Cu permease
MQVWTDMNQLVFNWAVAIAGALGGWALKVIWDSILEVRKDLKTMDTKMHEDFVRRDDFREAVREIKTDMKEGFRSVNDTLGLIFKKLDNKEDKE